MKTIYENPEMEIVLFSVEDVIATSRVNSSASADENGGPFGGIF